MEFEGRMGYFGQHGWRKSGFICWLLAALTDRIVRVKIMGRYYFINCKYLSRKEKEEVCVGKQKRLYIIGKK